jgi:hypothetical protein
MTFPDTTRYFKTDAYIVASSIQELYDAASAATLTLTGIAPTVAYRLRITLSGADCAGTVTMDGTETLKFTAATTKITTTNLTANALPTVTTANLSCNILIECLTTGGAPIYAETTTLIKVRHEPELVTIREPSGNFTTYNGYVMVRNSTITLGDKIRINSTDYHAKRIEPQSWLDGTETYRIVYF